LKEETMTESELRSRFEDLTLRPEELSHAEHVRLAWAYLREHPLLDVLRIFPENLKRYAASIGKESIYHETMSWAWLMLIDERMNGEPSWDAFVAAHPELLSTSFLERYYDPATLASERAKRRFVFPEPRRA
jgi:hypothetical protein